MSMPNSATWTDLLRLLESSEQVAVSLDSAGLSGEADKATDLNALLRDRLFETPARDLAELAAKLRFIVDLDDAGGVEARALRGVALQLEAFARQESLAA